MKGFLTSFRGRLTVMSLVILAIGLTAYAVVVGFVNLSRLSSRINADLNMRGHMLARGGPPRRGPDGGPVIRRERLDGQQPPVPRQADMAPPPGQPKDGPMRRQGPAGSGEIFTGEREPGPNADLRRARFIGPMGHVVGGFPDDVAFDEGMFRRSMQGEEVMADRVIDGQSLRVFSLPWRMPMGQIGVVQVARDLRDYDELRRVQWWTWIALTPLALALSAFGAFVLSGKALRPIQKMEKAASEIGQGDFSQRLEVFGDDELARLAKTFNEMSSNLEKSFADQASAFANLREAYESQKRFTADASHELRTPLARLQLATSSALRGPEDGYREALEIADGSARSMAKLIRELLVLARADAGQLGLKRDVLDLRLVVSDALNSFSREIDADFPQSSVIIEGDQDHLERVVTNLVENAIRHTPGDGPITVSLRTVSHEAVLSVEDAGEGISAEHLPHLFERFYRADAARGIGDGVGLGLAISKSVIEGHRGTIRVESDVGKGTRFEIRIPLSSGVRG